MADQDVQEVVLSLLEDICGDEVVREEMDMDLFEEGLLDSLAAIEVLVEIENRLGVVISTTEYTRDEMNTSAKIVARVQEKLA